MDQSVLQKTGDDVVIRRFVKACLYPVVLFLGVFSGVETLFAKPASEETKGKFSPTIVYDAKAEVSRSGEVEIMLRGIPSYGNQETFEIRSLPAHGTLTDPKNSSDHTASLTYHHDGSKAPLQDEFSYRAKAPGQTVSSPAKVVIRIIPPPPQVTFEPPLIDFGKILLSERRATNVVLINRGGVRAEGRILFPRGFSSTNGVEYQLDEGESMTISVEFSPIEAREYQEKTTYPTSAAGSPLILRGVGLPRFSVTSVGEGNWNIENLSSNAARISFIQNNGSSGWLLPPEMILPPASEKALTLVPEEPEGTTNISSTPSRIRITDGYTESVVELPPAQRFIPLSVQVASTSALTNLPAGVAVPLSFSLVNRSTFPKRASWKIMSPLGGGMTDSVAVELQSGEAKQIDYAWIPNLPGTDRVHLTVMEGTKPPQELLWNVGVVGGGASSPAVRIAADQKVAESGGVDVPESANPTLELPPRQPSILQVENLSAEITQSWFGNPKVLLRWSAGEDVKGGGQKTVIQECLLVQGSGDVLSGNSSTTNALTSMQWKLRDLTPQSLKSGAGEGLALISGLEEGCHTLILSRVANDGQLEARSQLTVLIPPKSTVWNRLRLPLAILGIILGVLYYRERRRV